MRDLNLGSGQSHVNVVSKRSCRLLVRCLCASSSCLLLLLGVHVRMVSDLAKPRALSGLAVSVVASSV